MDISFWIKCCNCRWRQIKKRSHLGDERLPAWYRDSYFCRLLEANCVWWTKGVLLSSGGRKDALLGYIKGNQALFKFCKNFNAVWGSEISRYARRLSESNWWVLRASELKPERIAYKTWATVSLLAQVESSPVNPQFRILYFTIPWCCSTNPPSDTYKVL